jgi:Leucine-rich repeat (LRR) protein
LNNITWVSSDVFKKATRLKQIYLGGNPLRYVPPGLFNGLVNLEEVFLNYLEITSIDKKLFHGLPRLNVVLLNDNNIKKIHEDTFAPGLFSRGAFVNLTRNPLEEESRQLVQQQLAGRLTIEN